MTSPARIFYVERNIDTEAMGFSDESADTVISAGSSRLILIMLLQIQWGHAFVQMSNAEAIRPLFNPHSPGPNKCLILKPCSNAHRTSR